MKEKHPDITSTIPAPTLTNIPSPKKIKLAVPTTASNTIPDPTTKTTTMLDPAITTTTTLPSTPSEQMQRTHRELFRKVRSTEEVEVLTSAGDENRDDEADLGDITYPPKDDQLKVMVQYILKNKTLPVILPEHFRLPSVEKEYPRHLIPEEMMCQHCPGNVPLSDPVLITQKAKILTSSRIVQDVSTCCKSCHQCGAFFRYQEWKDGIHNFNDRILLDLPLCITIRNMLQVHTAVCRVVEYLERTTGVHFPSADTIMQGYLHFEALTEHDYEYSCVNCGDHPPVVIMDLHKKGAFHLSVSDLSPPPEDFNGEVDMHSFWEALSLERIGQGFVTSQQKNTFTVPPSYNFWAPWIGPKTCRSNHVLNTEYQKVRPPKPTEVSEMTVTEDRLREELYKQKVQVVRKLCKECGLDSSGSRADLLLRLSNEMKSRQTYDKVFQKIWAASGGWAVIMCPCGIVYSIKCNIRAESPRDFADMLLSWKHMPNVIIYDFARGLATHMNLREPGSLPLKPFEGRLNPPTPDNIAKAKDGKLKVSLPWLNCKKNIPDPEGHRVTGSAEHYALYDRFHEDNTKDPRDVLRKLRTVPQLAGKVNSQVAEQLFSRMKKNNYFLNMALPSTHLFLMRNIIHHHNTYRNEQRLGNIKKAFGNDVTMNRHSQAVLVNPVSPEKVSTVSIGIDVPTELNPIQDKLLSYVLDTRRPGAEIIIKEGSTCLTREEIRSLGLQRNMDSQIGNACFKLIHEAAQQHGKDIYIEDMYVIPTWKCTPKNMAVNFPEDVDMKDLLVFPAWTNSNGPEHFILCGLPLQNFGNDCGIFILMYTLCIVTGVGFDFQERFAFWTDEARSLVQGALQPVSRVPRLSAVSEKVPVHIESVDHRTTEEKRLVDFIGELQGSEEHLVTYKATV
ncbi:uncharacterized protein LOC113043684 [Carassius auratus]|uniref:Uncharacterized protein LOC113043684 n=1 Tax=Carassius auratus TaxID=7957 RepID=A0A6P6JH78_CARAU|nr:uncharacterized protein LOC113043684 [Carassius auratus]